MLISSHKFTVDAILLYMIFFPSDSLSFYFFCSFSAASSCQKLLSGDGGKTDKDGVYGNHSGSHFQIDMPEPIFRYDDLVGLE
jgi:hypothetical protein